MLNQTREAFQKCHSISQSLYAALLVTVGCTIVGAFVTGVFALIFGASIVPASSLLGLLGVCFVVGIVTVGSVILAVVREPSESEEY